VQENYENPVKVTDVLATFQTENSLTRRNMLLCKTRKSKRMKNNSGVE
jgi:hypothetical protein